MSRPSLRCDQPERHGVHRHVKLLPERTRSLPLLRTQPPRGTPYEMQGVFLLCSCMLHVELKSIGQYIFFLIFSFLRANEREDQPGILKRAAVGKSAHAGGTCEQKGGARGSEHPYHKTPPTLNAAPGKSNPRIVRIKPVEHRYRYQQGAETDDECRVCRPILGAHPASSL